MSSTPLQEAIKRAAQRALSLRDPAIAGASMDMTVNRNMLARYQANPAIFGEAVFGFQLAPYQVDILEAFKNYKRVSVRGPHGLGKTFIAAVTALWALCCFQDRDVKVITTAGAWRQLSHYLWPEIRKWAMRGNYDDLGIKLRPGKELNDLSIKLPHGQAFAVASSDPALIEGAHASLLVYIFDEAKAIPDPVFDAAEGAFSGAGSDTKQDAYALAISTPGDASGRFYDIHTRRAGLRDWYVRHVTLEECIAAGRVSREWAEQRANLWGVKSAVYQRRVLGEFASSEDEGLVPLAWIEAANQRWQEAGGKGAAGEPVIDGLDVARFGGDETVRAIRRGNVIEAISGRSGEDTMQTAGRQAARLEADKSLRAVIDVIGIGAGVYDRLKEQFGKRAISCNVAESAEDQQTAAGLKFTNWRAVLFWTLREMLDPDGVVKLALPPDDKLTADLVAIRYDYTSRGRIQIESKEDIRARLGRSTDYADAVALTLYPALRRRGVWFA